ncbi:carbohydrate kinase family protein [bacterium]|nr:carbohydrate kinase family protein [bacterium]
MKIMSIGGATQDTIVQYQPHETLQLHTKNKKQSYLILEEGKKIEVENLTYFTGGGATNAAISFKRLGCNVDIFCNIGIDKQGDFIIKNLQDEGLTTKHITKSKTLPTGTSFIIPTLSGDRTIFAFRGANSELQEKKLPQEIIKQCNWLYITSLSGQSSQLLLPITTFAKEHNIRIANNPGISQLADGAHALCKSLPNIEILILNAQEAKEFMQSLVHETKGLQDKITRSCASTKKQQAPHLLASPIEYQNIQFDLRDFFSEVLSRGPKIVVVTNGAEGIYAATQKSLYFHPALAPQQIANTLGAGDAFGSCFTAYIAKKATISEALLAGIINASSAIGSLDAKSGLLSESEIQKRIDSTQKNLTLKFEF